MSTGAHIDSALCHAALFQYLLTLSALRRIQIVYSDQLGAIPDDVISPEDVPDGIVVPENIFEMLHEVTNHLEHETPRNARGILEYMRVAMTILQARKFDHDSALAEGHAAEILARAVFAMDYLLVREGVDRIDLGPL